MLQEPSTVVAPAPAPAPAAQAQGVGAATIAGQAPAPRVMTPAGPLPLEGLPRTAEEVEGLHARRDLLRDQLNRANNRRSELVEQLNREGNEEARAGLQQRLTALDERILEIERDQAMTERLLSNAPPAILAEASIPSYRPDMVREEEAVGIAMTTFAAGIALAMIVGRIRRGRFRRSAQVLASQQALPHDPRYEQLMQAVEAISEEVERIGEGQRFVTQLLSNRREAQPLMIESSESR